MVIMYINHHMNGITTLSKIRFLERYEQKLKSDSHLDIYDVFRKEDNLCIAYAWNIIDHDVVEYSALKAIPQYLNKHYPYNGYT